jgi:hypothetical protein
MEKEHVMTQSVFSVDIYNAENMPTEVRRQYARLRYECFEPDDPYVNMDNVNRLEQDHFDQHPATVYIVVTMKQARRPVEVVSAVRRMSICQNVKPFTREAAG